MTVRIGGRMHAAQVRALVSPTELRAPMPGHFVPALGHGDLVSIDEVIGSLVVLGRSIAVLAGEARGLAVDPGEPRAVAYGDRLVALDLELDTKLAPAATAAAAPTATGERVFRAPTSGRFYGRAAPDKPAFVTAGSELATGATVCLLEVMKTFHRVTYGDEPARVRAVLVADGDDVNAGDPLLAFE
ncbi:MAG: biotin/lipoyl-containing protein [Kofleriaceae bacterium]